MRFVSRDSAKVKINIMVSFVFFLIVKGFMLQLYFLKHENHYTLFLLKSQATLTFRDGSDKFHVSDNNPLRRTILLNLHETRNGTNE